MQPVTNMSYFYNTAGTGRPLCCKNEAPKARGHVPKLVNFIHPRAQGLKLQSACTIRKKSFCKKFNPEQVI
jgi:hypothetical protein